MKDKLANLLADREIILWAVGFIGVCVLVGLGKLKPETVEYMLFALVGRSSLKKASDTPQPPGGP